MNPVRSHLPAQAGGHTILNMFSKKILKSINTRRVSNEIFCPCPTSNGMKQQLRGSYNMEKPKGGYTPLVRFRMVASAATALSEYWKLVLSILASLIYCHRKSAMRNSTTGYILLLTILVISIVLAIGLGMYGISVREVVRSSFLRDSAKALAAATDGAECALYWDLSYPQNGMPYTIFATGTSHTDPPNVAAAVCNNGQNNVSLSSVWTVNTIGATTTTAFLLNFSDGTCVDVTVLKAGTGVTKVVSDGYNTCNVVAPRRTQREVEVTTRI